jgi:hypothetical protein
MTVFHFVDQKRSEDSLMLFCFRMVSMAKTLFVVVALVLVLCGAQVNFSPNWGKRSGLQDGPCKTSTDSLMYIYKLIQLSKKDDMLFFVLQN